MTMDGEAAAKTSDDASDGNPAMLRDQNDLRILQNFPEPGTRFLTQVLSGVPAALLL